MFSTSKRLARSGGKSNSSIKRWTSRSWWKVAQSKTFDDGRIPCGSWTKWMGSLWSILWSQSQGQRYRYNLSLIVIYIYYIVINSSLQQTIQLISFSEERRVWQATSLGIKHTHDRNTPLSWITRRNNSFVIAWVSKTSPGMIVPAIDPKLKAKLDLAKFKTTFGFFGAREQKPIVFI